VDQLPRVNPSDFPADVVIRVKRPDGTIKWLRVPGEHWPLDLGGPEIPKNA
jgi:hypothetical protein